MSESQDKGQQLVYSNLTRVTTTPEEVVLEFGVRPLDNWNSPTLVPHTRIAVSLGGAKRLAGALVRAVRDYESKFGEIEIDPARRVQAPAEGVKPS